MRYPKDHKEKVRQRMVETASRRFRSDGIAESGLIGLMAEVGLTQGAFYSHFPARDELVGEALDSAMVGTRRLMASRATSAMKAGADPLEAIVTGYLSQRHLDVPEEGCAVATLGAEMGRQSSSVRRTASAGVEALIDAIEAALPLQDRGQATAILALMAGTIQIARLARTRDEAWCILEGGRVAARAIASSATGPKGPAGT